MESKLAAEYLDLWDEVLASVDEFLPEVVASGLATTQAKISADALDAMREKHAAIAALRTELEALDAEHRELLEQLKQHGVPAPVPTRSEAAARVADLVMGLIVALQRDFAQNAELKHIIQNVYLFLQANS